MLRKETQSSELKTESQASILPKQKKKSRSDLVLAQAVVKLGKVKFKKRLPSGHNMTDKIWLPVRDSTMTDKMWDLLQHSTFHVTLGFYRSFLRAKETIRSARRSHRSPIFKFAYPPYLNFMNEYNPEERTDLKSELIFWSSYYYRICEALKNAKEMKMSELPNFTDEERAKIEAEIKARKVEHVFMVTKNTVKFKKDFLKELKNEQQEKQSSSTVAASIASSASSSSTTHSAYLPTASRSALVSHYSATAATSHAAIFGALDARGSRKAEIKTEASSAADSSRKRKIETNTSSSATNSKARVDPTSTLALLSPGSHEEYKVPKGCRPFSSGPQPEDKGTYFEKEEEDASFRRMLLFAQEFNQQRQSAHILSKPAATPALTGALK